MHISYNNYSISWYYIISYVYIYMIKLCIIDILHPSEASETVRHGTLLFQFLIDAFAYIFSLPRFQQDLCFFLGFPCIGFLNPRKPATWGSSSSNGSSRFLHLASNLISQVNNLRKSQHWNTSYFYKYIYIYIYIYIAIGLSIHS